MIPPLGPGYRSAVTDDGIQVVSRRSLSRARDDGQSRRTVVVALFANAVTTLVKLAAGLITGSASLLAESAHSLADTGNQVFMLVSLALGRRTPTEDRPFGHAQERFLWTLMAAVGMFLAGAVFAIGFGLYELITGQGESDHFLLAYAVLGLAFIADGTSWLRAVRQLRREAGRVGKRAVDYARDTRDPNLKMVLLEDSAALIGVLLAAIGIGLNEVTGEKLFDPIASVSIGILLVSVAAWMGRDVRHLLVGAAALPEEREAIAETIASYEEVDQIHQLLTLVLGPNALLVAARVDLKDGIDGERVEQVSTEIDARLREVLPDVTEVFLDATPTRGRAGSATEEAELEIR